MTLNQRWKKSGKKVPFKQFASNANKKVGKEPTKLYSATGSTASNITTGLDDEITIPASAPQTMKANPFLCAAFGITIGILVAVIIKK